LSKLNPISQQELVKRLRRFGFAGPFGGGKHLFMIKGTLRLTIPNPHKEAIGSDLLIRILRQAGISREEWINETL
jgi:predicted RNA binding protein YcfA (HicA-like mRNA interferase family)